MRTLYLDCFSGISGNMFLGALLDLGFPESHLRQELAKLPVNGYELIIKKVEKQGIAATYLDVKTGFFGQRRHRHLPDITAIIDGSDLPAAVKEDAKKVFLRLAEAEAKVHGTTVDKVHFHEVGAVDTIIDIVGTVLGLHWLGIGRVYTSKLRTGSGFVKCSHGRMPVPAPATAELLRGIAWEHGEIAKELVTPTGAALVAVFSAGSGGVPDGFISDTIGYGAGSWDLEIPNVVRAVLGEAAEAQAQAEYLVIEANIDDLNPQIFPHVMDRLFAVGARDVWLTPIIMKKGRSATRLSVLADSAAFPAAAAAILAETTTIGMRYYPVNRLEAERRTATVETPWGEVRVKVSAVKGQTVNAAPEYEDCRKLAAEHGLPLKIVWQKALSLAWPLYGRTDGGEEQ
ncbi:nickel pincer cofactor biosynthesis protein LarC [Anaeroselena agilis]|uniref:Pyridinium-3,5-bisthiocarboxylic acid mononucleotide nickel insertion protein n=1 Tax=Anaeroselena agilis TaxID=3063788 RepID=A0ABU3NYA0_9FIRM|nr:nickel pincer cofactor biosynthesis protein LarC [Selenomonadales bacterium 4137-cl]